MTKLSDNEYLFTSESVTEGHPDKIADQISDGVLDAVLRDDPTGRVACETLVNTGLVVVSGEITTETYVDIQDVARETIRRIGYTNAEYGFDCHTCAVINAIDKQSPDIAQGVDQAWEARTDPSDDDELDIAGAGDQGMMFGYASNETDELMPLPISLAHKLAKRLADVRKAEIVPYLRPDGKTQVTVRYVDGRPVEIVKLLISTQHKDGAESLIKDDLWEHVIEPVLPDRPVRPPHAAQEPARQPHRSVRDRRPDGRLRAHRAARSSSTPTAGWPATAAARSPARTPRRSIAPRRTPRATWPRTWSRRGSPTAPRSRSPTRSASRIRCR